MIRSLSIIVVLMICAAAVAGQSIYGSTDVKTFREGRDRDFRNKDLSPLLAADFETFKGLEYFEIDPRFAVDATLERTTEEQIFMMPTSIGQSRKYFKYGILRFEIDGTSHQLTVFRSAAAPTKEEYAGLLFIPFRDLTNGKETYGAGRYMDLRTPTENKVKIDFNLAYNMSCAYGSDKYSCAVPPRENFLQIKVTAGEKSYAHAVQK